MGNWLSYLDDFQNPRIKALLEQVAITMKYHTFLSYNSKHYKNVQTIYEYLTNSGLRVFFDKSTIKPGKPFQEEIEKGLRESASIIVVIGPPGLGPWQEEESYTGQLLSIGNDKHKHIIPVLLPEASLGPESDGVPLFLKRFQWFAFKDSLHEAENLFNLMQYIPRTFEIKGDLERPFLIAEQDTLLDNTIGFYNRRAELYYDRWKDTLPLAEMHAFLSELKRNGTNSLILDAGCGPGHHSKFFTDHQHTVTGIDLSRGFLDIANKHSIGNAQFILGDIRDLQSIVGKRNIFDGVWACGSCLHTVREALDRQLYEFIAVLKPGGVLGISLQVDAPSVIQEDGRFFERYEEHEIINRIELLGFRIVNKITYIGNRSTEQKKK